MINILKETLISCDGADYLEQLVHDSECPDGEACNLCFFTGYEQAVEINEDCAIVHGCTISHQTYFKVKKL